MALEPGEIASDINTSAIIIASGSSPTLISNREFDAVILPSQSYYLTLVAAYENAALDAKIGFNYILNRNQIYIGRKPMVEVDVKPLTGLVYPFITTYQDKSTIEFQG